MIDLEELQKGIAELHQELQRIETALRLITQRVVTAQTECDDKIHQALLDFKKIRAHITVSNP